MCVCVDWGKGGGLLKEFPTTYVLAQENTVDPMQLPESCWYSWLYWHGDKPWLCWMPVERGAGAWAGVGVKGGLACLELCR